ncbi:STE/STE20/PAKA protein kinase [Coprinopsis sp. MPI-PUGE-AT-0042]|nr:STE/STE20/PAKA protein kinase [Coprinopsis sp. MPI-PUGE-AT-0042]
MASSSSASGFPSTSFGSRFSTLKAFKFGAKDKDNRPPPPPPKDDYYSMNRSMASLSPDAMSLPPHSPLSPRQNGMYPSQTSSINPNPSTMSLASSIASGVSSPPLEGTRPQSKLKGKARSFLRFGRKSPRSPSTKTDDEHEPPPVPQDDGSISSPFNFQHNIHVDDGLVGLPPSWTTVLAERGFTEEEIMALQSRRVNAASPNQAILNTRPASPTIRHPYQTGSTSSGITGPIISQPVPRPNPLPKKQSDASLTSGATPHKNPVHFPGQSASNSTTSLSSAKSGSLRRNPTNEPQDYLGQRQHTSQLSISHSSDSLESDESGFESSHHNPGPRNGSGVPVSQRVPSHSTNGSAGHSVASQSSFPSNGHNRNESGTSTTSKRPYGSQPVLLPSTSSSSGSRLRLVTDISDEPAKVAKPIQDTTLPPQVRAPRRPGAPPRLSLHQSTDSGDLSSWAGALLSGISDEIEKKLILEPPMSAPASAVSQAPPQRLFETRPYHASNLPGPSQIARSRSADDTAKKRPEPLAEDALESEAQYVTTTLSPPWSGDAPSSSSPLWSELEGILGQTPSSPQASDSSHDTAMYSAALTGTFSPVLPFTPEEERMSTQRNLRDQLSREFNREEDLNRLSVNTARPNRDSSRSSTSTLTATVSVARHVSVARRANPYVINSKPNSPQDEEPPNPLYPPERGPLPQQPQQHRPPPINPGHSPTTPNFGSEESSNSGSTAQSQDVYPTPTTSYSTSSPLRYYLEPSPSPSQTSFSPIQARNKEYPPVPPEYELDDDYDDEEGTSLIVPHHIITAPSPPVNRPTITIEEVISPTVGGLTAGLPGSGAAPGSPFQRYRGWLSEVLKPLESFIDEGVDPRDHYLDLKEIAEGESGSVFSARLTPKDAGKLRLSAPVKAQDKEQIAQEQTVLVAIKSVQIVPSGSPKLKDLQHELGIMKGLWHENIITLDALYMDFLEDTLWIRMELMERSLADMIALVEEGLMIHDRMIARFASDILNGLDYLQQNHIAHRDVRSDNLLINHEGCLKLTDFASAVQVTAENPMRNEPAGVLYWQAPEIRSPPYNALKVDVWALGATVWEVAETVPPFSETNAVADRWPAVSRPEVYSPAFHDFLRLCSDPVETRLPASELLKTPFIKNACGRLVIKQLIAQCVSIESALQ